MAIVAFISAVLAGMGVGSAGFLVVFLTVFEGSPQLSAQLMNLIFFISSSLAAIVVNLFKKRLDPKIILLVALPGVLGAFCGASFAHSVDKAFLGKGFGIMLVLLGTVTFFSGKATKKDNQNKAK